MKDTELGQFLNWFIRHYETSTTEEGLVHYVSAEGDIVTISEIIEHYLKEIN